MTMALASGYVRHPVPLEQEFAVVNAIVRRRVSALIIGLVALVIGIVLISSSEVKCGSKVMQEGQVCEVTRNGSTVNNTYEEQKRSGQQTAYIAIGVGILALIVGAAGFALNGRRQANPR
jgi:hypothetical protein